MSEKIAGRLMDDMVEVPRELVERMLRGGLDPFGSTAAKLRSCLPWEPPAEQVEALLAMLGHTMCRTNRRHMVRALKNGREQGWELRRLVKEDAPDG